MGGIGLIAVLAMGSVQEVPPTVSLGTVPSTVAAGAAISTSVSIRFAEGFHGYQNPPSDPYQIPVSVGIADKGIKVYGVKYPKGEPFTMQGEELPVMAYIGETKFPITFKAPAKPGKYTIPFEVKYQQCTDRDCYAPQVVELKATIEVVAKL